MNTKFKTKLHVLIAEDNPVDSRLLVSMLSTAPHGALSIKTADSLEETYRLLEHFSFDVILLDLNLSGSIGLQTLHAVNTRYPDIAIVVNTGAYQDDLGLKAVKEGAQDYLIKGMYKAYVLIKSLYYAVERKKAEQELRLTYNRLKETQTQLIQAEKMNIVGAMASGVAHEVKNPLATILYGIEFLHTCLKDRNEKVNITLKSIKKATQQANNIIMDLLDFASLSALERRDMDINTVIDQSLQFVKHQFINENISVVKKYSGDLPKVNIDKNRIQQVIVDILLNAQYAMAGGGTLSITTHKKKFSKTDVPASGQSSIEMKERTPVVIADFDDTGPGVKDEDFPKLFDPFFTTRRATGGVGLGLSVAKTIIDNHEGIICISNLNDKGTRARLIFRA